MDGHEARHYLIEGMVQGVGFRYFTMRKARELGLAGWVRNLPDGRVEARAAGRVAALEAFEGRLREGPPASRVARVSCLPLPLAEAGALPAEFAVTP